MSKQLKLIGLLYDNPNLKLSNSQIKSILKSTSSKGVICMIQRLRKAGAPIKTIKENGITFYKYGVE